MTCADILTELLGDGPRRVGLITLDRPKALNAPSDARMGKSGQALLAFDRDGAVG